MFLYQHFKNNQKILVLSTCHFISLKQKKTVFYVKFPCQSCHFLKWATPFWEWTNNYLILSMCQCSHLLNYFSFYFQTDYLKQKYSTKNVNFQNNEPVKYSHNNAILEDHFLLLFHLCCIFAVISTIKEKCFCITHLVHSHQTFASTNKQYIH